MPTTSTIDLSYDSLGRVLEDCQSFGGNTRSATYSAFTSLPATRFTYPSGRQTDETHDALYRRVSTTETSGGATIGAWQYFGPGRVAEVTLGNGLIATQMNNARTRSAAQEGQSTPGWGNQSSDRLGYDGAGRMTTKRYLAGGIDGASHGYDDPTALVGNTTAFDHASNKLYERSLHAESRSHLYEPFDGDERPLGGYDSLDRLRQYQRGELSATGGSQGNGGGSITTPITLPNTDEARSYDLDGLGNWRRTAFTPVGGSATTEVRQHNGLNQITSVKEGASPKVPFAYDGTAGHSNGNLADDGERLYAWDALNRLKVVRRKSDNAVIGEYTYDALGRRIRKVVTNGGLSGTIPNGTTDYLYTPNWQCVEERDGTNFATKQYVWGLYIDELIQQKTFVTINGHAAGDYYPLQDLLYRTLALTDSAGDLIEVYDYDAYGNTLIFDTPGTGGDWWADDAGQTDVATCEALFTGQRWDAETELYLYRMRYYVPKWGRFVSRDPIINFDGLNHYAYVTARPVTGADPFGLCRPVGTSAQGNPIVQVTPACGNQHGADKVGQCFEWDLKTKQILQWVPCPVDPLVFYGFEFCWKYIDADCYQQGYYGGYGNAVANCAGPQHTWLRYTSEKDGKNIRVGWGIGGPQGPIEHGGDLKASYCYKLQRAANPLKHGQFKGVLGTAATDAQILDCIKSAPARAPYKVGTYDCRDWSRETIVDCGLADTGKYSEYYGKVYP